MLLLRAIVTGFGLTLGAAIFKKHVQSRLGLDEDNKDPKEKDKKAEEEMGMNDPNLHRT